MKCSLLTLSCYVDDELEDRRRGEMEAHLVGCSRCRSGLSHIREEVDRIGALARVRVVDESAHALLVQLGLIEPDDELPERGEPGDDRTATLPPWLQGHAGAALPWSPERPVRPPPAPRRPDDEPVEMTGPPAAHRRLSALDGVPSAPFDLSVLSQAASAPRPASVDAPPTAAPEPAAPSSEASETAAPAEAPAAAAPEEAAPARKPLDWVPPAPPPPPIAEPVITTPDDPPAAISAPATAGEPSPTPPPGDAADRSAPPLRGDPAVAVWTSDPAEAPAGADYPITDEDALAEPLPVERFAARGPAPAARPGLVGRVRERLALHRAMGEVPPEESVNHDVEIVSGTGAPMHSRGRSDLARRRADALRPAAGADLDETLRPRREPGVREMLPPPARPASLEGVDSLFEQPAPPAAGPARATPAPSVDLRDVAGRSIMPRRAPHDSRPAGTTPLRDDPHRTPQADSYGDALASTAGAPARRHGELSPATSRSGRRAAITYAAAIVVIGVVGIVSGRVTTHIPTVPTSGGSAALPVAPPASSQAGSSSASSASASASKPAPATSAVPSAAPGPSAPASIGSGGSGWSVQAIRVGDHGTYFRLVFDLGQATPSASGQPKVALTYPDARTLVVTITGAAPSAAAPSVGSSAIVSGIAAGTPAPAGSAVYRITLSKPGTAKPLYLANPLRVVVDVSAS